MASILRVRVRYDGWTGGPGLSTLYFLPPSEDPIWTQTHVDEAFSRVRTFLMTFNGYYPSPVQGTILDQADVLNDADGELLTSFIGNVGAALPVGGTGGLYATASAVLLKWHTLGIVHGHALKGKMFLSPLSNNAVTMGLAGAALVTAVGNGMTAYKNFGGPGPVPCVWSRPVKVATQTTPARPGQSWAIVSGSVNSKLAVLRSRRD